MKKTVIMISVLLIGVVAMAGMHVITIAAGSTSGTWINNSGRPQMVQLSSLFGKLSAASANADTVTVTLAHDGVSYTVDTGTIASNATTVTVDFGDVVYADWGDTVTVTRTPTSTNAALNALLITE